MRKTFSVLATAALAAGISLSAAAPAQAAGPYCFGLPDEPLAYVCVTVNESPTLPNPSPTWGEPIYVTDVPAACYGIGCTEQGPLYVSLLGVSGVGGVPTLVEVYWGGQGQVDVKDLVARVRAIVDNPFLVCTVPPLPEYIHCNSTS